MKKFEAGKTYKAQHLNEWPFWLTFINSDNTFKVDHVDADGDPWSKDVLFEGDVGPRGWCVCSAEAIEEGIVVEVS